MHKPPARGSGGYYNRPERTPAPKSPPGRRRDDGGPMRETILAEQTHAFIRVERWGAAVLPFGATEPHNLHLPYGTDTFQVEELGRRATARAWEAGARVLLLPALPYGVNTNY